MRTLLLGHLAQFATFSEQGEVLCTQGLAYLLQDSQAKSKFAAWIGRRAQTRLKGDLTWHAERIQKSDRGRPDLEARIDEDKPVVKIEAKLGANLSKNQLHSYANDLKRKNRSAATLLLVLVPRYRIDDAVEMVHEAFRLSGLGPWRPPQYPKLSVAVITWDDVMHVLAKIRSQEFRNDLDQLRAMYRVLTGDYTEPFAGPEDLAGWREREPVFDNWVDRVTQLLKLKTDDNIYPMGREKVLEGRRTIIYRRRYVGRPYGKEREPFSFFSIGVRDPFFKNKTPIWLRFHKETPNFSEIQKRISSSCFEEKMVSSGGHIWIPLDVKFKADTNEMVNHLIKQAKEVIKTAY